jgi:hypothetical protein
MIGKQTKGRGFRGALNYVLGKDGAEIIGGNMLGQDARELAAEFSGSRQLKPNLSRVVYHASLSLPPGESLSDSRWGEVSDRYMEGMGFKGAQYVAVKHTDTDHAHIHIIASRVRLDGSVVSESHDYRRSETLVRGIEKEFGLFQAPPSRDAASRAPTSGELHKGLREKKPSMKLTLQHVINQAACERPTMGAFVSSLESKGVEVIPNIAKTGRITGISFRFDGEMMKGSDLGRSFTWLGLQKRGIMYEQNRDFQRFSQAARQSGTDVRYWSHDGTAATGKSREHQATFSRTQPASNGNGDFGKGRSAEHFGDRTGGGATDGRSPIRRDEGQKLGRDDGAGPKTGSISPSQNHNRPFNPKFDHNGEHILRLAVALLGDGKGRGELAGVSQPSPAAALAKGKGANRSGLQIIEEALKPIDDQRDKENRERQEERERLALARKKSRKLDRGMDLGR